jgi:hypothetical protein
MFLWTLWKAIFDHATIVERFTGDSRGAHRICSSFGQNSNGHKFDLVALFLVRKPVTMSEKLAPDKRHSFIHNGKHTISSIQA